MDDIKEHIVRIADLPQYGLVLPETLPLGREIMAQPVFCLHCCQIYRFDQSALGLDGLLYCPVVGCEGTLIDQIPVVETPQEHEAGKGWLRSRLTEQFGEVALASPLDLIWSRLWAQMSPDEVTQAVMEAWA